ncbi:hypothetical protein WM04_19975 [Burkholderia ubonensis]|uniref:hypothetical protein n=2 Tax=Burkholderia ubonensis TaxID=101571 RepID=UPI0007549E99|nr:hypothetical protein [Burkholderia ubonensis]KWC21003.1 hypothetical protein WL47_02740 [Burkholderia ubonensis]KWI29348.1 hypothetical protein WM04_19975 [Burkholderia ubonensis]OJA34695.1 hypothetical protein BGV47_21345 [Burkholderia ubonensis]OJB08247.1 hypothetical protein BGV53_31300 [Burkholderia ubonensis]OJB23556.1 hypothetical protein BGV55_22615 [Burkholderia ubonensis]
MNVFKLRQGEHGSQTLTAVSFHFATSKKFPWYQDRAGKIRHYAVCPECDNPIHIVNLDVDRKVDNEGRNLPLYAKHALGNIEGIGAFDPEAYEDCSLANPKSLNGADKTRRPGKVVSDILEVLRDHADALHYIIERFLGASISDELYGSILRQFHKQEGYLYRAVSTSNLPYSLLYMAGNQSTYGCFPKPESVWTQALAHSAHFEMGKWGIRRKSDSKAQLRFFVTDHEIKSSPDGHEQKMMLVVEEEYAGEKRRLLTKNQTMEIQFFRNMLSKRMRLREIACKEFPACTDSK